MVDGIDPRTVGEGCPKSLQSDPERVEAALPESNSRDTA